jgi:hypothetical protein
MAAFSHNPNALQLFEHHPLNERIVGFKAFNDWCDNREFHKLCGLPEKINGRPYGPSKKLEIYPAPEDVAFIDTLPKKYAVLSLSGSGGARDRRTYPPEIAKDVVATLFANSEVTPVLTGSHYVKAYAASGTIHEEFDPATLGNRVISAIDKLTLSGLVEAMNRAEFTIVCNSFGAVASWGLHKPTFYMCHQEHWDAHQTNGKVVPRGFFHECDSHPLNSITMFESYKRDSFIEFLRKGGWKSKLQLNFNVRSEP